MIANNTSSQDYHALLLLTLHHLNNSQHYHALLLLIPNTPSPQYIKSFDATVKWMFHWSTVIIFIFKVQ